MNRRKLIAFSASSALAVTKAFAFDEPFPVYQSDADLIAPNFRRFEVDYKTAEPPGTIVVDSQWCHLYFVLPQNRAMRYGVGVGREGFGWTGEAIIRRKAKWPIWHPTPDQLARDAHYAEWSNGMPGGTGNPLGARAMYLFQNNQDLFYRIHGTADPQSIGHHVSSGCIRMINMDVMDLYERADVGTRVVVS